MPRSIRPALASLAAAAALCISTASHAGLVMSITEVGSDVVFSMNAGTVDTTGLTASTGQADCGPSFGFFGYFGLFGASVNSACKLFTGVMTVTRSSGWSQATSPSSFGQFSPAAGTSAVVAGENLDGNIDYLFLANTAASGPVLGLNSIGALSGTLANRTLRSMGLVANQTLEFKWASDSILFTTGPLPSAVPEPTSLALALTALAGLGSLRSRRR